ncbi:MAG TPA: CmcI family methyltransferase [Acidimicrobiia bacterium]|nr:CmcI family methyltransferase [Acidimicrobiia bacterium]
MKKGRATRIPRPVRRVAIQLLRLPVVAVFSLLYYGNFGQTLGNTRWLGISIIKNPLDLWIYQEIVHELRPDLIIETGTWIGGSALYLASLCDLVDHGRVVTIDIVEYKGRPEHKRIEYITGSSVEPKVIDQVLEQAHASETVMVILDSNHRKVHVLDELRLYAPLVTVGSYLIVEDTNVNGHPNYRRHGPGPWEAVEEFMREDSRFEIDKSREKFMLTFNPRGYLRRTN